MALITGTYILQPHEEYPVAVNYATELAKLSPTAALSTGKVYASNRVLSGTTFATSAIAGATTISVVDDVQAGARLILNPGGANKETHKAATVSGTGPYTVTLAKALAKTHAAAEAITYEPGLTAVMLVNGLATIINPEARALVKGSPDVQYGRITFLVTTTTGAIWEDDLFVRVKD